MARDLITDENVKDAFSDLKKIVPPILKTGLTKTNEFESIVGIAVLINGEYKSIFFSIGKRYTMSNFVLRTRDEVGNVSLPIYFGKDFKKITNLKEITNGFVFSKADEQGYCCKPGKICVSVATTDAQTSEIIAELMIYLIKKKANITD